MVAQGYISLSHIASEYNVVNVFSKNWGFKSCYENLIKPLLSYHGDGSHYDKFDINKLLDAGLDVGIKNELALDSTIFYKMVSRPLIFE